MLVGVLDTGNESRHVPITKTKRRALRLEWITSHEHSPAILQVTGSSHFVIHGLHLSINKTQYLVEIGVINATHTPDVAGTRIAGVNNDSLALRPESSIGKWSNTSV